jgi:hypothetical protein
MILIPSATQLAQVAVAGDVDIASLGAAYDSGNAQRGGPQGHWQ